MEDFDTRFRKNRERFDRDRERIRKTAVAFAIVQIIIMLAVLAGISFTIYKVMVYLGVF